MLSQQLEGCAPVDVVGDRQLHGGVEVRLAEEDAVVALGEVVQEQASPPRPRWARGGRRRHG